MCDCHDAVAGAGVVLAQVPRQGVEVRELPGVQEAGQQPGARRQRAGGGRPAHQGRNAAHCRGEAGINGWYTVDTK